MGQTPAIFGYFMVLMVVLASGYRRQFNSDVSSFFDDSDGFDDLAAALVYLNSIIIYGSIHTYQILMFYQEIFY